jgi:hypothetical protein
MLLGLYLNPGALNVANATDWIAAEGVYAVLSIFLCYLWRRSLKDYKAASPETRDNLWREHRDVVKTTKVLIAVAIPVWAFATFIWPMIYRPATALRGSVSNLIQLREPRPSGVFYVDEQVAPEQNEVKFYMRSQLSGDQPAVTLEWALWEDGQFTDIPFIFSHRYKEKSTPAVQLDPTREAPAESPSERLERRRFLLKLPRWAAISASSFDCQYYPDSGDPYRKVGAIRCFQDGKQEDIPMQTLTAAASDSGTVVAAARISHALASWFRPPAVFAQKMGQYQLQPTGQRAASPTEVYLSFLGSSDLNVQLQASKVLRSNLANGNGWDSVRKALGDPGFGADHSLMVHNLGSIVQGLPNSPPDIRLKLAKEVYKTGDFKASAPLFNSLTDSDLKEDVTSYYYRGVANLQSGNYGAAPADLQKYVEKAPDARSKSVALRTLNVANDKAAAAKDKAATAAK